MSNYGRREFIAACCALSLTACNIKKITAAKIALGNITQFSDGDNVLDFYRLIIRRQTIEGKYFFCAMSKLCTHQSCLLNFANSTFTCPCHGSQFSNDGSLLKGPAQVNLPYYRLSFENQQIFVSFSELVEASWKLEVAL